MSEDQPTTTEEVRDDKIVTVTIGMETYHRISDLVEFEDVDALKTRRAQVEMAVKERYDRAFRR